MNWNKANLQQLLQIIRFEKCPSIYKVAAINEIQKRMNATDWESVEVAASLHQVKAV